MTKNKALWTILAIFVIFAFVLSACGPSETEAPAEEPAAEEPVAEEPAEEEPVAEEPAEEEMEEEMPAMDIPTIPINPPFRCIPHRS